MRCTVLLTVTLNGEKLTPLIFTGKSNGRIAANLAGMPASLKYGSQDKAWVDQRVFKHWIMKILAPFALKNGKPAYHLMDEFSFHLMSSCYNQIKDCGTEIDFLIGVTLQSIK
jgi:DDE superfamily endonuclease